MSGAFICSILAGGTTANNLPSEFPLVFRVAAYLRTTVLMFIVIPLSFMLRLYTNLRLSLKLYLRQLELDNSGGIIHTYVKKFLHSSNTTHQDRANEVVRQIGTWNKGGRKRLLRTSRSNWLSMSTKLGSNKGDSHRIQTSNLDYILDLDQENLTISVEPMVTFGELSHYLVPKGYALKVHVEMESITVGGAVLGFGMETNCHRTGFLQETVKEYELVMNDGSIKVVTAESDAELFYAIPWSHGTVGFLTRVTLELQRVKPYVKVYYIPTQSRQQLNQYMIECSANEDPLKVPDFLEATMYNCDEAVIQCGDFVDEPQDAKERALINGINYFFKPFYYKWVETFLYGNSNGLKRDNSSSSSSSSIFQGYQSNEYKYEYIPYYHFMHRFSRSIFWEVEDMIPFANHPIYRCIWGWMGPPEVSLLKLFQGPVIRKASVYAHVVQESIMPIQHLEKGIEQFNEWFNVYPLLVFPLRIYDRKELSGFLNPKGRKENLVKGKNWGIWVDLGAYGVPKVVKDGKTFDAKRNIREMEHWTRDIGGFQALYTDIFATEKEMRQMFDHTLLDKAREKYNCLDAFPAVYEKIKPEPGIVDLTDILVKEIL